VGFTKVGILTPDRMKAIRNYIIVLIFITSAIITPPDIVSQVMVALPMIALYQISIFICKFVKEDKRHGSK
jgi:sec-independent protein translocase protein TatC